MYIRPYIKCKHTNAHKIVSTKRYPHFIQSYLASLECFQVCALSVVHVIIFLLNSSVLLDLVYHLQ